MKLRCLMVLVCAVLYGLHIVLLSRWSPGLRAAPLHGLAVVDGLASRWGVESLGNAGKTVWVDLLR